MKNMRTRLILMALALTGAVCGAAAQDSKPAYLDPSLSAVERAKDLVSRMTLEEKASQLVNQARGFRG